MSTSTPIQPLQKLGIAEARQSPCLSCSTSPCCTHLPLHRFHVRTLVDLDHAIYLLNFDRIELGIGPSGEWSVFYAYPCRFLDTESSADHYLCKIHGTPMQPQICVHYNPYTCWYRHALGSDPGTDFVRVDRRRLGWISERVRFDAQRTITEVPSWEQLDEMCKLLPLESEPVGRAAPPADAVYERWLEESAAGVEAAESPPRSYRDFNDPCTGCEAHCCKTLLFPHGRPTSRRNLDYLQFALGFPGVEVGISDGEWQLVVKSTCRHLTPDHRCGVYGQAERPLLCRYYDASSCSYVVQFGQSRPAGFLRVRLEQFDWLTETVAFDADGTITQLPDTENLRLHIESRWQDAVEQEMAAATAPSKEAESAVAAVAAPPSGALKA